jgi:hypothetical protein
MLYSIEFPQASVTCQIKFWYVVLGGQCELNATLFINDEREALLYRFYSNANISTWVSVNIDLG